MKKRNQILIVVAMAFALGIPFVAQAADLVWDANGTTAPSPNDGVGTWLAADRWWDGATNATWNNGTPDNAIIGNGGAGGTITLGGVTAGSVTFTNFTGTYTLSGGTNSQSGGITIAANAGNVTFTSCSIQGAGGITKNGTSTLSLGATAAIANTFTGPLRVLGGIVKLGQDWNNHNNAILGGYIGSPTGPNVELNGGVLGLYYDDFDRTLGAGAGQFQITGGRSGLAMLGNPRPLTTFNNNASYEVVWGAAGEGAATGFFNPSVFVMGDSAVGGADNCAVNNKIDLNGADRTVETANTSWYGQLSGIITNSTGTAGIIKTGAGELQLTQANSYNGGVTVSAGTLTVASLANGGLNSGLGKSSSDAANLLLANGTTLKYTGGAASSDRSFTINGTAAGHTATLNASGTGALNLTSTATPAYGSANQTRTLTLTGTNTANNTLAATLADNGTGKLSVTKAGAGKWVLTGTNTYTGPTTLDAGMLSIGTANNLGTGGNLVINGGGLSITGTTVTNFAGLGRTIVFSPGVVMTLDIAAAANTFSVDQSLPTGGLVISGAGNLGLQSSVTNLILNTPAGVTATYGGVIADGAPGMSVTKTGAGTQILTGTNTYTGVTYLNGGTLSVGSGSTIGKLSGTTGLTFNGGTLQFNRSGVTDVDAFPNTAPVTVNSSSTFGATSADAGNANANETIGAVTLTAGQMNFNWSNGGSSGNQIILTSLSRSGTASANFNSGFAINSSRWKITGAGTTTAGQIIGPWYTTGGNNANFASTDYAVYSSDFVAQAAIAGTAESTWTVGTDAFTQTNTPQTLSGTRTMTALRNTAATATTALNGNFLETYGLLNGVGTTWTISGTGAIRQQGTTATNLYVTAGAGAITISAPINDNTSALTLVKNGSSTLTLSSTNNTYSGGTVVNAGSLALSSDSNLGVTSGGLIFNGTGNITYADGLVLNANRTFTINAGATLTLGANITVNGVFSGAGTLNPNSADGFYFPNPNNDFSGTIICATAGQITYGLDMASIGDSTGAGLINLGNGITGGTFRWIKASGGTTTLTNRQFALSGTTGPGVISVRGTNATENLIINKDLLITGVGNKTLTLAGTNTGDNRFAGNISDGPGSVISLIKAEAGTWTLSGTNTFTGSTTVSDGRLVLAGSQCLSDTAALTIASGKRVQLDTGVKEKVGSLVINSVTMSTGKWGRVGNTEADFTDAVFLGDGLLYVGIDAPLPPPSGTLIIVK